MKNNNVCKFPPSMISNELIISCFVFETDINTMANKIKLKNNRMILIEHGEGTFDFNGDLVPFETGTILFGFEGEHFSLINGNNVRYLYVDFSGTRGKTLLTRFGINPYTRKYKGFNSLIPFCKDLLISTTQENIGIAAESVLLYVLSRFSTERLTQNDTLEKIIEYTKENFQDPELSISNIATEIGYNPKYLSHFFKQKTNTTYSEYLRSVRFKHAISLFELGLSSIKNVALLSGFTDPLYFSNAFKKEIGVSPKKFITNLNQTKKND